MVRVLVCGDRNWTDIDTIRRVLDSIPNLELVIEGESTGADTLARNVAREMGVFVLPVRADWPKYKKAAGPIRNRRMIEEGKPNLVVAFHNDLSKSKGTRNTVELARKFGIPVKLVKSPRD